MHLSFLTVTAKAIWIAVGAVGLLLIRAAPNSWFTTKAMAKGGPSETIQTAIVPQKIPLENLRGGNPALKGCNGAPQLGRSVVSGRDEFAFMVSQLA